MAASARGSRRGPAPGEGSKRLALWIAVLGLPVAYELSATLTGPRAFYRGDPAYWYAGFDVDLVLMAVAAAAVGWALFQSRSGLAAIGWPRRLPAWQAVGAGATVALALVAALFYHPPLVSSNLYSVSASSPTDPLERVALVAMALVDAVVQESVWRGAVITWLRPVLGVGTAALLSAAAFIFLHPAAGGLWVQILLRGGAAAVYTGLFLWRRSLGPGIYLHFVLVAGQILAPIAAH